MFHRQIKDSAHQAPGPARARRIPAKATRRRADAGSSPACRARRRGRSFFAPHRPHPVSDRTFPFDAASKAYACLGAAAHFGKVVITFD